MSEVDEFGQRWKVDSLPLTTLLEQYQKLADKAEEEVQKRIKGAVEEFRGRVLALIALTTCGFGSQVLMDKVEAL